MIIGIQGLKTLGPVTFDFGKIWMKFEIGGQTVHWDGCPWISEDSLSIGQLKYLVATTQEAYICYMIKVEEDQETSTLNSGNSELSPIIQKFSDIFETPEGLPPQRERDHHIHLLPGSHQVNVDHTL